MSFYINNTNAMKPGPICGNATQGLCEKVLIETTKVFDACLIQLTETNTTLTVTNFNPAGPTLPLTFISAEQSPTTQPTVSNVVITRLDTRPNFANVTGTITIPVVVTYRDANNVIGTGTATITRSFSVVLFVPQPSMAPINVIATALFTSTTGTFTEPNIFTISNCIRLIIKIVATVDILVPSYGYPCIPECQNIAESSCPGIADLPTYPIAISPNANNQ